MSQDRTESNPYLEKAIAKIVGHSVPIDLSEVADSGSTAASSTDDQRKEFRQVQDMVTSKWYDTLSQNVDPARLELLDLQISRVNSLLQNASMDFKMPGQDIQPAGGESSK